jgi:poly(hydroxyalkanoate) granule-associated protein
MIAMREVEDLARRIPEDVVLAGRAVWLAGLGAVGMAAQRTQEFYEEGQDLFARLVKEGRKLQDRQAKKVGNTLGSMVDTTVEATSARVSAVTGFIEDNVQAGTKAALNVVGLPSRRDINILTARLELLQGKVQTLNKKGAGRGR